MCSTITAATPSPARRCRPAPAPPASRSSPTSPVPRLAGTVLVRQRPRLHRHPGHRHRPPRRRRQPHPALQPPQQRQGRTLPPDRPTVARQAATRHHHRRATGPTRPIPAHLQHPADRTGRSNAASPPTSGPPPPRADPPTGPSPPPPRVHHSTVHAGQAYAGRYAITIGTTHNGRTRPHRHHRHQRPRLHRRPPHPPTHHQPQPTNPTPPTPAPADLPSPRGKTRDS